MAAGPTRAQVPGGPGTACRSAVAQAQAGAGLPPNLLGGIARVESGRRDPATGQVGPWPWTINAEGQGRFFDTKPEAVAYATELRRRGVQSFDVGCLQINMLSHPDAFASLDDAFDPLLNARYAVHFLQSLKDKLGSWDEASAWYHSANPDLGVPYRQRVTAAMADEAGAPPVPVLSYAAAGIATAATPALAFGNVLSRPGSLMMLPRPGMTMAAAGGGMLGRGLDSYRSQPVSIIGLRMVTTR